MNFHKYAWPNGIATYGRILYPLVLRCRVKLTVCSLEDLKEADPVNSFKLMWDKNAESRRMCELTMPVVRENYAKFDRFCHERINKTAKKYTAANFCDVVADEWIDGFVCGSDTIFCIDEFKGFDAGYFVARA